MCPDIILYRNQIKFNYFTEHYIMVFKLHFMLLSISIAIVYYQIPIIGSPYFTLEVYAKYKSKLVKIIQLISN